VIAPIFSSPSSRSPSPASRDENPGSTRNPCDWCYSCTGSPIRSSTTWSPRFIAPADGAGGGFRLLFALWVLGPVDSKTVAAASGMSRPAVTALVRTLERDGMVQKLGDPHDGRSVVIALTGDGQDRLSEAFRRHTVREQRWSAALDDDEKSTLIALLMKLSNAAQDDWVRHR
jgi:DNA-binding MarR family transcriptional regulator